MDKKLTQLGKDLMFLVEVLEEFSKTHGVYLSASCSRDKNLVSAYIDLEGKYPEINQWINQFDNQLDVDNVFYE